jgi:hypothetical protein
MRQRIGWRSRPARRYTHLLFCNLLAVAAGCNQPWGWPGSAPRPQPPGSEAAQSAPLDASLYANPLTLDMPASASARASQEEVLAFLERLPKPGDSAPDSAPSAAPSADEPQRRTARARTPEPPPVANTPGAEAPTAGGDIRDDGAVATNTAAQIPSSGPRAIPMDLTAAPAPASPTTAPKLETLAVRIPSGAMRAGGAGGADGAGAPATTANMALSADSQRERTVEEAIENYHQRVSESPEDVDVQWRMRTLLLAVGREQEALAPAPASGNSGIDLLMDTLRAAAAVRRAAQAPAAATDDALTEIETVREKLRRAAELAIPGVALCSRVTAFGVYDELPSGAFVAGSANRAIVYCEVRNFASEKTDDERYRTLLSSRLELLTPDGRSLWQKEEPQIEDLSRRRREDFFLAQKITLPTTLAPGEYVLKVTIADRLAQKTNEATQSLKVLPGGSAALDR